MRRHPAQVPLDLVSMDRHTGQGKDPRFEGAACDLQIALLEHANQGGGPLPLPLPLEDGVLDPADEPPPQMVSEKTVVLPFNQADTLNEAAPLILADDFHEGEDDVHGGAGEDLDQVSSLLQADLDRSKKSPERRKYTTAQERDVYLTDVEQKQQIIQRLQTRLDKRLKAIQVRVTGRTIPPRWRSIRLRLAPCTCPPWGCIVRVVGQTKPRKIPA